MKAQNIAVGPTAKDAKNISEKQKTTLVPLMNPDSEDFTTTYDINEDGKPVSYTIKSQQIQEFPQIIAEHIKKHLSTQIMNKRGVRKGSNWEDDRRKIINEEITVNLETSIEELPNEPIREDPDGI